jgi:hypothetical protein
MRRPHDAKRERPDRAPEQEKDGREHHRRQVDIEHVDEFGEDGAADGSAPLLLPIRGFGDETGR